jgi:hypothetical protein
VVSTALVPFTLFPFSLALLDLELAISLPEFMARLAALVGGAFAIAWLVRRLVSRRTLTAWRERIDGLAVMNLFVFALAIMDGVTAFALERPGYPLLALALATAFICFCRARDGSPSAGKASRRSRSRSCPATATWVLCWSPGRTCRYRSDGVLRTRAGADVHAAGAAGACLSAGARPRPASGHGKRASEVKYDFCPALKWPSVTFWR